MYQGVLVFKLLSVIGFAGGAIGAFLSNDERARKRAAHYVASPCLLGTWLSGYALLTLRGWPVFELWIVGSIILSFFANTVLAHCVRNDRRGPIAFLTVAAPIALVVVLMVLKPTWRQVMS